VERFNPAFRAVESFISNPKYIEAVRTSSYTFRSTDIGVVLDLMIHDLDVVLSLVDSKLHSVHAIGISIFGDHEDIAQARLHFVDGCVVNLTASRCSFVAQRHMQVFTETGYARIDFADHKAFVIRPNEKLTRREINFNQLTADQKQFVQDTLFEEYLRRDDVPVESRNAIQDEQQDFLDSIRNVRQPQVCGQQGSEAVAVAEQILESIAAHRWSSAPAGPVGALAIPQAIILPGPQPVPQPSDQVDVRKAG
jgi:predicted dehydrogenase